MKRDLFSMGGQEAIEDVIKSSRGVSLAMHSHEIFTDSSYEVPIYVVIRFPIRMP